LKQNATGKLDMRNRQYDSRTGRFTQEDPMGLAGGSNLYGFGGGDAVNYSDPFGLCPACDAGAMPGAAGAAAAGAAGAASALIAATSDATIVAAGIDAVAGSIKDKLQFKFITYTRVGPNGQVYSGRTSGFGDPQSIVNARAATHPGRLAGFAPPVIDEWAAGPQGYFAIRGREQQLIDAFGGAQSEGGTSANLIRGVSKSNPLAPVYSAASITLFGPLPPKKP
jgi:RHS repeat-associated protein